MLLFLAESNTGMIVGLTILLVIIVAIVAGILLHYKRRVQNLKTEIAHVKYISDEKQNGPTNFDNPVYQMQTHPNDSTRLINKRINNVDRSNFLYGEEDSACSSRGKFNIKNILDMSMSLVYGICFSLIL